MKIILRIPIYFAGILFLALGITLLNKSNLGTTPLSSIPYVLSKILAGRPFWSLGALTLMFHILCIAMQVIVCKKMDGMMLLQFPVGLAFSALLNFCMGWLSIPNPALWLRAFLCAAGIAFSALGIVVIVHTNLMLPAPDALIWALSTRLNLALSKVKIAGDVTWVCATLLISFVYLFKPGETGFWATLADCCTGKLAVGIGTLFSMYFTGKLVGVFKKRLWFLEKEPPAAERGRPTQK